MLKKSGTPIIAETKVSIPNEINGARRNKE
jgi:hypothetical protein